jgi:hypothetical protein
MLGPNHPQVGHTLMYYAAVLRHLHNKIEARDAEVRARSILSSASGGAKSPADER